MEGMLSKALSSIRRLLLTAFPQGKMEAEASLKATLSLDGTSLQSLHFLFEFRAVKSPKTL